MLLTVATERPLKDGTVQRFALRYRLQFAQSDRGLKIVSTLVAIDSPVGGGRRVGWIARQDWCANMWKTCGKALKGKAHLC
jgi:hypothetical protein